MEPPGTAPGSDPLITGAFIAIVRANPNNPNIGLRRLTCKTGPTNAGLRPVDSRNWTNCPFEKAEFPNLSVLGGKP